MAHAGECGLSKRSGDGKMKGVCKEGKAAHEVANTCLYHLFLESRHTHHNMGLLLDIFSTDKPKLELILPKHQDNPKVPTEAQTRFPVQAIKQPTCLHLPEREDINANEAAGLNVQTQTYDHHEYNVPVPSGGSGSAKAPAPMERNLEELADILAVQQAYLCALHDPDQITPLKLIHQSPHALKDHYARDILLMSHSGESLPSAVTREQQRISGCSQMQHSGQHNVNHSGGVQQQMMRSPVNRDFRLICIKGQISGFCANPHGSRLIQHALETATPEEIIIVYEEVIPYARMLTIDVFANYTIQKLLECGQQLCKRKFISHLIGHVLPLSLHMYGCHVIQKAFEVGDLDLKVQMANEYSGKVLECARDQYANHAIQKCMECVPAQHIQFVFRCFCRKAMAFSTNPYGCRIIQKVLAFCNDPEIYHTLVSEIVEAVVKLASDPFGNYVVQYVVEQGGPVERSVIVKKFAGRAVSMSYNKFASNVIEKCLTFGSFQDRQLITTEIINAGDGQHLIILWWDMMGHLFASFVIQKAVVTAEESQLRVLVEVAHRNTDTIMRYPHGRRVLAHIQSVFAYRARGLSLARVVDPQLPGHGQ